MSATLRVLVAAGNDLTRVTTAALLRACTAGEVLEVSSAREALDTILNGSIPDVLLLDTQLGSPTASEMCRHLRAQRDLPQPDIWLLSPADSFTQALEALEAGADDLFSLPLAPHLLQARLQASSRRQRARSPSRFLDSLLAAQGEERESSSFARPRATVSDACTSTAAEWSGSMSGERRARWPSC